MKRGDSLKKKRKEPRRGLAGELAERDTPVEIEVRYHGSLAPCPKCRYCLSTTHDFCHKCGQKIVWKIHG